MSENIEDLKAQLAAAEAAAKAAEAEAARAKAEALRLQLEAAGTPAADAPAATAEAETAQPNGRPAFVYPLPRTLIRAVSTPTPTTPPGSGTRRT